MTLPSGFRTITPIHNAIKIYLSTPSGKNLDQVLQACRENHQAIDLVDRQGTALTMAAQANDMNLLALLIAQGADATVATRFGSITDILLNHVENSTFTLGQLNEVLNRSLISPLPNIVFAYADNVSGYQHELDNYRIQQYKETLSCVGEEMSPLIMEYLA